MGRKKRSDRTKPDHWTIKAKSEGFEARSVYKLEEMNKRFQIFEKPQRILDLGCAPGSWSQLIRKRFPKSLFFPVYFRWFPYVCSPHALALRHSDTFVGGARQPLLR